MFTHRSQPSLSLLVMCVVTQALVMCTYSMTVDSDCKSTYSRASESLPCSICREIRPTVEATRDYVYVHLPAEQAAAWSQIGTQLSQSQRDGICNLLALREVAERAQGIGTAAAISSSLELLEQNLEDACKVVFADSNPDHGDCKDALRYNCFLDRTRNLALNRICSDYDQYSRNISTVLYERCKTSLSIIE